MRFIAKIEKELFFGPGLRLRRRPGAKNSIAKSRLCGEQKIPPQKVALAERRGHFYAPNPILDAGILTYIHNVKHLCEFPFYETPFLQSLLGAAQGLLRGCSRPVEGLFSP